MFSVLPGPVEALEVMPHRLLWPSTPRSLKVILYRMSKQANWVR